MKKLTIFVLLLMTIILAGCGSSERKSVVDTPADEISTALNLSAVKNGVSINSELDKSKDSYYDVKIAADASSSLFYSVVELDDYLNADFKDLNLKVLYFNEKMNTTDLNNFIAELNNESYGLSDTKVGKVFSTDNCSKTLYGNLDTTIAVNIPDEYDLASTKENVLVVAYLPVYCVYNEGGQDYSKVYLLVPVFYSLTFMENSVIENSNFTDMNQYQITLNEAGYLPSKEVE